jgi:translation initiation factor 4G
LSDDAAATVSSNVSDLTKTNKWIPQTLLRSHRNANGNLIRTQEDKDNDVFRRCRALLNKLTPEKFDKLADDLANPSFGIDSPHLLKGVILLIFDKALAEPNYCSLCKSRSDWYVPDKCICCFFVLRCGIVPSIGS